MQQGAVEPTAVTQEFTNVLKEPEDLTQGKREQLSNPATQSTVTCLEYKDGFVDQNQGYPGTGSIEKSQKTGKVRMKIKITQKTYIYIY